jgi:thiamine pyrophosphokinase
VKGLLIIGGLGPSPRILKECGAGADIVMAADSGLESAVQAGIEPDLVVGDMDSISDARLLEGIPEQRKHILPVDKDETDTEYGLRVLRDMGCTEVVIAGGGGGRLDHALGIAMLFERGDPPRRWVTEKEDVRLVEGEMEFGGREGGTVSLFPIGAAAEDMHSEGLKWPLDGLRFARGYAGISNLVTSDRVLIRVGKGKLLMIAMYDEEPS